MSVEVVAVASWGPRWVCWRGHPGVSSPCAWVSSQPGGWIPRACIPRENLVLEVTQNHFCYFFFFFFFAVRRESLSPPHVQGKGNETLLFTGIFENYQVPIIFP